MDSKKNKSKFQFNNPRLVESLFLENSNYNPSDFTKIHSLTFHMEKSIGKIIDSKKKNYQETIVFLSVFTSKNIKFDDKTACYIRVTMKANFRWDKEINNNTVQEFLNINAPALLLSYIRPKISDLTKDSEIPTQEIPFIDFSSQEN